jgi:hypothetical protein
VKKVKGKGRKSQAAAESAAAPAATAAKRALAVKTGTKLNADGVAKAQQKDNTATRALTATTIKTSDGQCLFIDPTSGNARENQIPVQTAKCDGSSGQQWDVITKGEHIDAAGNALIVSSLVSYFMNLIREGNL